jgi:undecaprenyl-diphosphatase
MPPDPGRRVVIAGSSQPDRDGRYSANAMSAVPKPEASPYPRKMSEQPAVSEPAAGTTRARQRAALTSSVVAILVVGLCGFLVKGQGWTAGEFAILQVFSDAHSGALNDLALAINWLFAPTQAAIVTVVLAAGVLLVTRDWRRTVTFVLLVVVPWLGCQALKLIVARPRPDVHELSNPLIPAPHSFSYPSGHTLIFAVLGLALFTVTRPTWGRSTIIAITGIGVTVVAWSRIYLGVHYPTDVFAAILYALPAVTLTAFAIDRLLWPVTGWARPAAATTTAG